MKNWLKLNWPIALMFICFSAIMIILFKKKPDYSLEGDKLNQISEQLKAVQHERDSIQKELDRTQDSIVNHIDSLLHVTIDNQNKTLYELSNQRSKIVVPNYGSDSLRNYFSKLRPIYHDLHTQ